jgi:uncharacterized protein YjbJ (UPF0337 family)
MNTQLIIGNWEKVKGSLKQKYAKLTDDDLLYVKGKEEELFGRIQKKLGMTKEAVELIIKKHNEHTEGNAKDKS